MRRRGFRLQHMLHGIARIAELTAGKTIEDYLGDQGLRERPEGPVRLPRGWPGNLRLVYSYPGDGSCDSGRANVQPGEEGMRLNAFLEELLQGDTALIALVYSTLNRAEPIINSSRLPFFPEYTDHGPPHNVDTLQTAVDLIHEDARPLITSADAAALILAVLLHDCGMHITEDGFVSLIQTDSLWNGQREFRDRPWHDLWEDFMAEASRFDGRKLTALFGNPEPVSRPPLDPARMTTRDKLLIGEFLRRHHPRLAHDIALHGVPAPDNQSYRLFDHNDLNHAWSDLPDLVGLVARSHGVPLRACLGYLQKYHLQDYKRIHAVYAMTLLRVADYLQIQSQRAPKEILEVRRLRSPVSNGEWKVHQSIRNITLAHDDPEAIFIDSAPLDVKTFLRVKDWLSGIQYELDTSWAVLGEIYGRYTREGFHRLGLSLRRVRSNLDDPEAFASTVTYVPARASFETANPDLLKLLVGPLYGDRPEIGIRELLQNAVDSVREIEEYLKHRPDLSHVQRTAQQADVVITIELDGDEPAQVEVSDRGIGMNLDVVLNYFLKAGATFRQSDAWKRQFQDSTGDPKVLRSGRFGVGVLAAFLIGHEIHVTTRHIEDDADHALEFRASIDSEVIEITRTRRACGTTIRVTIPPAKRSDFKGLIHEPRDRYKYAAQRAGNALWDFYCLKKPSVVRRIGDQAKNLEQRFYLADPSGTIPANWRSNLQADYQAVHWTFDAGPKLAVNGIIVMDEDSDDNAISRRNLVGTAFEIKEPRISVFDPNGRFPLNLQRTALASETIPFEDDIFRDVVDDFIAWALLNGPNSPIRGDNLEEYAVKYEGMKHRSGHFALLPWISTDQGFLPTDEDLICGGELASLLIIPVGWDELTDYQHDRRWVTRAILNDAPVSRNMELVLRIGARAPFNDVGIVGCSISSYSYVRDLVVDFLVRGGRAGQAPLRLLPAGKRLFVSRRAVRDMMGKKSTPKFVAKLFEKSGIEYEDERFLIVRSGSCPEHSILNSESLVKSAPVAMENGAWVMLAEWFGFTKDEGQVEALVVKRWRELFGCKALPYLTDDRERRFASTYRELAAYLDVHRGTETVRRRGMVRR